MMKLALLFGCIAMFNAPMMEGETPLEPEIVEVENEETGTETTITETTEEEKSEFEQFVEEYLNADKVAMYLSWFAYIGTIIGLVANVKKLTTKNNLTLKNVSDDVKENVQNWVNVSVKQQMDKFLPAILSTQEKSNEVLGILIKIMALSQENTPESRLAILELIGTLGSVSKEVVDNAKKVIEEEVKAIEEHKEEMEQKIDEIVDKYDGTSI